MTDPKQDDQTGNAANNTPVLLRGQPTEEGDSFAYLRSIVNKDEARTKISLLEWAKLWQALLPSRTFGH